MSSGLKKKKKKKQYVKLVGMIIMRCYKTVLTSVFFLYLNIFSKKKKSTSNSFISESFVASLKVVALLPYFQK